MKRKDKLKYKSGEHLVTCDICGFVVKASKTSHQWDGLIVCDRDEVEQRPVYRVLDRHEGITVSDRQPEASDTFIQDFSVWGDVTLFWNHVGTVWEDEVPGFGD